jgi:tight adherence protein C
MLINNSSRRSSVLARRGDTTPFDRVMAPGLQKRQDEQSFLNRVLRPLAQRLTDPSSALMRNVNFDDIRYRLLRAGFPYGLRAQDFMLIKLLGTAGSIFLFTVMVVPLANILWGIGYSPLVVLWGALLGAFYGFKLPDFWLSMTIRRRQSSIQIFMPDMIDLITVSVEAGLGLDAAIQRVSQRFANPLSEEFMRAMQEVRLGRTRVEALRDMARRTDVPDLTSFITSLVQAELLGIAIANVLRLQSERLREKRSQRAREQAQKAPIKMVFPLVLFIFPALFVVILGPALIQVLTTGFGG